MENQAAKKFGGSVMPKNMHIVAGKNLAVVQNYEEGRNLHAIAGKPAKVFIRATNVFRKEAGKWKMIGHHTDLISYLEKKVIC